LQALRRRRKVRYQPVFKPRSALPVWCKVCMGIPALVTAFVTRASPGFFNL